MDATRLNLTRADLLCALAGAAIGTILAFAVYGFAEFLWWLLAPAMGFAA